MTRDEVLRKAKECVCGSRVQDYGNPEDNFKLISDFWDAYLRARDKMSESLGFSTAIDARDVAIMMALLKIARIATGTGTEDCYVDLAGYAACAAEAYENNERSGFGDFDKSNFLRTQAECC